MSTKIEWADETWSPITGCTPASKGCQNCYAKALAERFQVTHGDGHPFSQIQFHQDRLDQPLHWRKPRKVFVCSMGDLFHEDAHDDSLIKIFDVIRGCVNHTFMILTKRPARMKDFCERLRWMDGRMWLATKRNEHQGGWSPFGMNLATPMSHIWLGVSVENQRTANERIPILLDTSAAKRFVSVEPMLEDIDIGMSKATCKCCKRWSSRWVVLQRTVRSDYAFPLSYYPDVKPGTYLATSNQHGALCVNGLGIKPAEFTCLPKLDWVICGAETGAHKRPCKPEWIDSLRQQCVVAGVPFFGKKDSQGQPIMPREWPEEKL